MDSAAEVLDAPVVVDETTSTDASAAPETASPPALSSDELTSAGTETGSDRPRDEHGRFVPKGAPPAASDATPVVAAAPLAADPITPTAPAGEPFIVRGDGQKVPVPDATLDKDGNLLVKAGQVPAIRQLLAEGLTYRGSWRKERAEATERVTQATAAIEAKAKRNDTIAVNLFDKIENPDWLLSRIDNENVRQYVETIWRREADYIIRDVTHLMREADLGAPKAPPQEAAAPDPQQLETAARSVLDEELETLLEGPQARTLFTSDDRKALIARYQRRLGAYFVDNQGSIALDREILKAEFDDDVKDRQAVRKSIEDQRKANEFNAKRNAPPAAIPPVVSTKGPPAPPATSAQYKDRDEWRRKHGMV